MAEKPSIPKGTRDFTPLEMSRRNYIFDTVRRIFRLYGYLPVETPAMEQLTSLMGKYGDEGDKLLFKILNSGDFKKDLSGEEFEATPPGKLGTMIAEKGLRYDLTVPFARFVVQHRNEITFPFKRYQIQPVWRADRPQRGRYREFYQCDVDVIGSDSLLNEHELVTIMDQVFSELGLRVAIRMNNRKVLLGLVEALGIPDRMTDVTVAIDKLEKVGLEKVLLELQEKGIATRVLDGLKPVLQVAGSNKEKLTYLEGVVTRSATGMQGIHEARSLLDTLASDEVAAEVRFDLTLARGLNYYTGTIFEVQTTEMEMGSICGGGRYDDLTGIFGLEGVSGVGVSFGADRIYDVMLQLDRFPGEGELDTRLLFVNFGPKEAAHILPILRKLRQGGIASELYPDAAKMKKQMGYADARGIPYVALVGEEEMKKGVVTLKEMATGTQEQVTPDELLQRIRS
jgi:histidyl-tRNA synthetase